MNKYPFTDDDLREASKIVRENLLRSLPQETDHEFSKEFEDKIDLMYRNYVRRQAIRRTVYQTVAAIIVLAIIGTLVLMNVPKALNKQKGKNELRIDRSPKSFGTAIDKINVYYPTAIDSGIEWTSDMYINIPREETCITYSFSTERTFDDDLPVYEPDWMPKGYYLVGSVEYPVYRGTAKKRNKPIKGRSFTYENPDNNKTITIEYQYAENNISIILLYPRQVNGVYTGMEVEGVNVTINKMDGIILGNPAIRDLIWLDEEKGIVYHIYGNVDRYELVYIGKNLREGDTLK